MTEIATVFLSWQFVGIALLVALIVSAMMKMGGVLWKTKNKVVRQCLVFLDGVSPWLPPFFGGALGAIPQLPRPGIVAELPEQFGYPIMIILGLLAGYLYERVWKSVKQVLEARGLKLNVDLTPKEQKKSH